ncbi:hypothetical protein [Vibrio sp. B1FLJ16]|uniref:hypothetical protein n=1 Tax=Vibrio sp. B1FLJ16 TaxID=2751178 RepID=UPI0015F729D5|nr:hypothetical protein [Vibrio sp. B1FLJ16]CAD7807075.1 hypothetical protein ACOMICROBIO_EPCKBFOG_01617 [Vibrio sp. B1FLJ16]CAE6904779.1 hypothetical protein ACOMICROBIO_EPCKBFOG_01617 [Vibrio sp. B1FLJ16]
MLSKLNNRLSTVAKHMADLEFQLGTYLQPGCYSCLVKGNEVFIEYEHDLAFDNASSQAEALLRLFNIPLEGDEKKLLVEVVGNGNTSKLHLDLSCDKEDDLLLKYVCAELLSVFRDLEQQYNLSLPVSS